jgi:hypothetical protein
MSIFPERWMGRGIPTDNLPKHYIKDGKMYCTRTNIEVVSKSKKK